MAEQFKMTPATRVFGMGLPKPRNTSSGTFRGIPVLEDRQNLDPMLRNMMMDEQQVAMQEQALDTQQKQLQRQMQIQDAEDAAINDLGSGEEIGNIFRKNPALALSRNFNQLASLGQPVQPSRATQTLAPSLLQKIPAQYHGRFNELIQTPEYANNPLGAKSAVELEAEMDKQRGDLVKSGVPLERIERGKLYKPEEFESIILQHGGTNGKNDPSIFLDKHRQTLMERLKRFEDAGQDEIPDPAKPGMLIKNPAYQKVVDDLSGVESRLDEFYSSKYNPPKPISPDDAAAANITSPAATGGGLPAAPEPIAQAPVAPSIEMELSRIPVTEQPAFLEKKKTEQAEIGKVNEEWTNAKKGLEEKLKEKFPDKPYPGTNIRPLEQLALQIFNGVTVRDDGPTAVTDEFGRTSEIPIHEAALRQLKLPRFEKAFTEPGKARTSLLGLLGTQDVTYNELIRDWAEKFLKDRNLIQVPLSEQQKIAPEERAAGANLLNKYVPSP